MIHAIKNPCQISDFNEAITVEGARA